MSDSNPGFTLTPASPSASPAPVPSHCKVVLAKNIADKLMAEVKASLTKLPRVPHLVGFLANTDPAARMYADWTAKTCNDK